MEIAALIAELNAGEHEKYPVATIADIEQTESAIGYTLPVSFRKFVSAFSNGAYLFMLQEVSAVGAGNPQIAAIQDIEWLKGDPEESIEFRNGGQTLLRHLIPFSLDGNGNAWCFLTEHAAGDSEYHVAYFDTAGRKLYCPQDSFASWLSVLIDNEDEVIRTVCDHDILIDELKLG